MCVAYTHSIAQLIYVVIMLSLCQALYSTMIPLYPHNIVPYLSWSKHRNIRPDIDSIDYLSWEDGLWALLEVHRIPSGSVALVPSFWCIDVMNNMRAHGLQVEVYPVDMSFQTDTQTLQAHISRHNPKFIVIFHAVGIRNTLLDQAIFWNTLITRDCIVIEDCAHQIVDVNTLHLRHPRHFVLDSWRKVLPLQGSRLYGNLQNVHMIKMSVRQVWSWDNIYIIWYWLLMHVCLYAQSIPLPKISSLCGEWAEKCMLKGYDRIGDSMRPLQTLKLFSWLRSYVDRDTIAQVKATQVVLYDNLIGDIIQNDNRLFSVKRNSHDGFHMRAYPVGLRMPEAPQIITSLRAHGLLVRAELDGCEWAQDKSVIYLPLGMHIQHHDIHAICKVFRTCLGSSALG